MLASPPLPPEDLQAVLDHTRPGWVAARDQSFFITGGTGFFGRWLVESFIRANDQFQLGMRATILTRNPAVVATTTPHLVGRPDLHWLAGDIRTFAFPSGQYSHVIHAATEASAHLNESAPQEMLDVIVAGTRQVLDFAAQAGTRKLLLTSSGAVYGPQPTGLTHVPEEYLGAPDPLLPASAYGLGKRLAEHLCAVQSQRSGFEAKIARGFAFVGPLLPLDRHFAIGNFIRDALLDRPIVVNGDGTPRRSYLYASDLAIWLWTILFNAPPNRAYNVGSAADVSIAELAKIVRQNVGSKAPVQVSAKAIPGAPIARYVPSVDRAAQDLGLQVRVPLNEAIRRTAQWHQTGASASVFNYDSGR